MNYQPFLGMNVLVSDSAVPLFYLVMGSIFLHVLVFALLLGISFERYFIGKRGKNHA